MLKIGQGVRIKDEYYDYQGEVGVIDYISKDKDEDRGSHPCRVKLNIGDHRWVNKDDVELLPKSWDTLAKGDVVVDKDGGERTVLLVEGDVIGVSCTNKPTKYLDAYTKQELIDAGYTIKNAEEEVTELTIDQIAEKFGKPVDKIKIKK